MTGAWPRKQQPHISFIEFQIYPRSTDLSSSYRHPHPSNAKGTLVVTDDGGGRRGAFVDQSLLPFLRVPNPIALLSFGLRLSQRTASYLQLPHSILHNFGAFRSFHLGVSEELQREKKERKRFNVHPYDMRRWLELNNLSSSGRSVLRLDMMMSIFIQSSKHRETSFEPVILPISNRWSH